MKVDLNMEGERTKVYSASFLACHKENLRETTLKQNFFLYFARSFGRISFIIEKKSCLVLNRYFSYI